MILKEKMFIPPAVSEQQRAADVAESEVLQYLVNGFARDPEVFILADIRLLVAGELLHIEYALIHPAGVTIVDSRSLSGHVQLGEDGAWLRNVDGMLENMTSPVTRIRQRVALLRAYLRDMAWQPSLIDRLVIDGLLVVTNNSVCKLPHGVALDELCPAESVCARIRDKRVSVSDFQPLHRKVMGEYLIRVHHPRSEAEHLPTQH